MHTHRVIILENARKNSFQISLEIFYKYEELHHQFEYCVTLPYTCINTVYEANGFFINLSPVALLYFVH